MDGYKHFVRVDDRNRVIYGYTIAFEQPKVGDVCIVEDGIRQFQLSYKTMDGVPLYKVVNGELMERTQEEIDADISALPTPPPTSEDRIAALETLVLQLGGVI